MACQHGIVGRIYDVVYLNAFITLYSIIGIKVVLLRFALPYPSNIVWTTGAM